MAALRSTATDPCLLDARDLLERLRRCELSAREVMAAHLARIEPIDPRLNAIVALLDGDAALALADEADARLMRGEPVGPLHGLPFAFKDMQPAVGFPCTMGSPILRNSRPLADGVLVERIRRAGVLPIGKTNAPEFGLGSHTYSTVYGTTRNRWNLEKSAGGSLRIPASFNNVVGFRPSTGFVPNAPAALPIDPARFAEPLGRDFAGVRVAWCPDLGGLPLDRRVRAVLEARTQVFEELGWIVEEAQPRARGDLEHRTRTTTGQR